MYPLFPPSSNQGSEEGHPISLRDTIEAGLDIGKIKRIQGGCMQEKSYRVHGKDTIDLNVPAPPFDRNPSSWKQRVPICVLAGIAMVMAGYMALFQWGLIESVWDPFFGKGSEQVLTSDVANKMDKWLHIPDAAFGAWAYFTEIILGLVGSTRRWQYRPWMVVLFGIDIIPLGGVSAILVLSQGFIIGSWCFLCLCSAVISFILIAFAYDEVWASLRYLKRLWQETNDARLVNRAFWGFGSEKAEAIALRR